MKKLISLLLAFALVGCTASGPTYEERVEAWFTEQVIQIREARAAADLQLEAGTITGDEHRLMNEMLDHKFRNLPDNIPYWL